jgi:hypothetical protein
VPGREAGRAHICIETRVNCVAWFLLNFVFAKFV